MYGPRSLGVPTRGNKPVVGGFYRASYSRITAPYSDWPDAAEAQRIYAIARKIAARQTTSKRFSFPQIPSDIKGPMRAFLEALKQTMEVRDAQRGSPLDSSPTFQDLIDSGVLQLDASYSVNGRTFTTDQIGNALSSTVPDWVTSTLIPPAPTNVVVALGKTSVDISWDDPSMVFPNYDHTEIWRSTASDITTAVPALTAETGYVADVLPPPNQEFYYWLRHVSKSGLPGAFHGLAGASWASGMPSVVSLVSLSVVDTDVLVEWAEPPSNVDIKYYVVYALDAENDPITPALGRSNTTWFFFTPPGPGAYRFGVMAIPMGGDEPVAPVVEDIHPVSITVGAHSAPLDLSYQVIGNKIEFAWAPPASVAGGSSLRIDGYEIWHTAVGTGTLVQSVGGMTNKYRVPIDFSATSRTYFIVAVDSSGTRGAAASLPVNITAIEAPSSFAVAIEGEDLRISWENPASLLPLAEFEVQYGPAGFDWDSGTKLPRVSANSLLLRPTWNGSKDFKIKAYDINGNASVDASTTFTISAPGAPTGIRADVIDNNVLLYWTPAERGASQLPVREFEVRRGNQSSTWATATPVGTKQGSFTTVFESASGTYRYHMAAVDSAGQYGESASLLAVVSEPPDYILNASLDDLIGGYTWTFDDNTDQGWSGTNATLTAVDTTLVVNSTGADPQVLMSAMPSLADLGRAYWNGCEWPTIQVRLRRTAGTGSETGTGYAKLSYGRTDANGANSRSPDTTNYYKRSDIQLPAAGGDWVVLEFDMSSLTAGTTDWMVSRITSLRIDLGATSADDFVIDWIRALPFKLSNMVLDGLIPKIYGPVDPAATFATDFIANPSWTSVQAKIDAGFTHFLQKSATSGYIEKTIDYGTTLPGIKITNSPTFATVDGAVTQTPTISTSNTSAVAGFTDNPGAATVFGTNFRWVKIRWDFSCAGNDDTLEASAMNTKTDAKIKNDMGMGAVSVAASGAVVNFNVPFVDVQSITVTPKGSASGVIAIYDFTDTPNPTSFTVYLFNTSGTKITGDFSWAARGY